MPARFKFQTTAILAAGIGVAAVVAGLALRGGPPSQTAGTSAAARDDAPERCLESMLDSARRGDVDGWLNAFAGDARETLAAEVREKTRELAAAELKAAEADLKSFVTTGHQRLGESAVAMVLERIYPRHSDRHRVRLERTADGWRIVEIEPIERSAPEIPYGTPVVPE